MAERIFCECRNTFMGKMTVAGSKEGIDEISFGDNTGEIKAHDGCQLADEAFRQLDEYFHGRRREFELPLNPKGTVFQKQVWAALRTIPYGETRSYGEIAAQVGNPKAFRAVGMANNKNPISIVVPCHRVIGKDGSLTGYEGGLDLKKRLLELEKANLAAVQCG